MKNQLPLLHQSYRALCSEWAGASPALVIAGSDAQSSAARMSDSGLLRVVDALSCAARSVGALQAVVAAEVAVRSRRELGPEGLASRAGHPSAVALLAQSGGCSTAEAAKLTAVGDATRLGSSFTGERMPARRPIVRAAVQEGRVSIAAAAAITRMLDRVGDRASVEAIETAERLLIEEAKTASLDLLSKLVKAAEAVLDQDGVAPTEDALRCQRSLSLVEEASGMTALRGRFDPVTAAAIKAAIDSLVGAELRRARDAFGCGTACTCPDGTPTEACACVDPALVEHRTITQLRADALADIARHAIGCEASAVEAATSVVVRIDATDLYPADRLDCDPVDSDPRDSDFLDSELSVAAVRDSESAGFATIDGIDQPISAASARVLAASAAIIPLVLGGNSAPLDLGMSQRLFTRLQRLALADRDGGCAHPGCSRPPSFCQAHHIRWWEREAGPTDIANGILLCSYHHHHLHRNGWEIRVIDNRTWFIPPPHIDPGRRPRAGNSTRRVMHEIRMAGAGRVA